MPPFIWEFGGNFTFFNTRYFPGPADAEGKPVFTTALRIALFQGFVEAGARYRAISLQGATQAFQDEFTNLGYDVRVNIVHDGSLDGANHHKRHGVGGIYIAFSSMRKDFTPDLFRIGGYIRLPRATPRTFSN